MKIINIKKQMQLYKTVQIEFNIIMTYLTLLITDINKRIIES